MIKCDFDKDQKNMINFVKKIFMQEKSVTRFLKKIYLFFRH